MIERYSDLAATVLSASPRLGPVLLVGVDGASGTGKTTFAERLAGALAAQLQAAPRQPAVVLVHTDDLLAGWDDLTGSWSRVHGWILAPLSRGEPARYRGYDWHRKGFGEAWQEIGVPTVLVLEGVGATRAEAVKYLSMSIFMVVADQELRLRRVLARDGADLLEPLRRWMRDEERHLAADGTRSRADLVVDGAPACPYDQRCEYDQRYEYVRLVA